MNGCVTTKELGEKNWICLFVNNNRTHKVQVLDMPSTF